MQHGPFAVPAAIGLGLTVAVWAKHSEVLKPVIVSNTVDVVYLNGEGLAVPLAEAAILASVFEQAGVKQPHLNIPAGSADQ
jgi:hypothetical protein